MALKHEFSIIKESNSEDFTYASINHISILNTIILYVYDTFKWIDTCWNGDKEEKGLSYYGDTIIKHENVDKFKEIVVAWIMLFDLAPDEFVLTGNYLPEDNKYEKNTFNKQDVLSQLKALNTICEIAIKQNKSILHNGV